MAPPLSVSVEMSSGSLKVPKMADNSVGLIDLWRCFPAIPDYIASQRAGCARSFWPGFLFGRKSSFERLRPFEFQVLSVIRKSGSRFSGEIALQPLSDAKETT
jgi:hypothetical protein